MRKAVVDQILIWMFMFIGFVTLIFMVFNYYIVMKVKDNSDLLANYGSRMKALGREDSFIIDGLNAIKSPYFDTISSDDLICTINETEAYQIKFSTNVLISNNIFESGSSMVYSYVSAFNEANSNDIECSLNLRKTD